MKYKLEVRGWSNDSMAFSLDDKQLEEIETIIKDNGVDELWEVLSDLDEVLDIWDPNLFQHMAPADNDALYLIVMDEDDKVIVEFGSDGLGDPFDNGVDFDEMSDDPEITADPTYCDADNVMLIVEELKGGIYEMSFESEEIPKPIDFSVIGDSIGSPVGDFGYISRIFFKDKQLEIGDWLDNSGKGMSMYIFTKDNRIIY